MPDNTIKGTDPGDTRMPLVGYQAGIETTACHSGHALQHLEFALP
jgi:hypothetical protein